MKRTAVALLSVLGLAACAPGASGTPSTAPASQMALPAFAAKSVASPARLRRDIKHVVIIVQENRSFENLFAGWPGADAPTYGFASNGVKIPLHRVTFEGPDISHGWIDGLAGWDGGKMDGFGGEIVSSGAAGTYPYAYLEHDQIAPYRDMARQYVLADRMFPTEFGGSFTAHLDLIAGTTNLSPSVAEVEWPPANIWGCDAPPGTNTSLINAQRVLNWTGGPFPCFTQFRTMADTLDAAHVSWKYYAVSIGSPGDGWSSYDAIRNVRYGRDWKNVVSPPVTVIADIARGRLAGVSWVTPNALNSDHAGTMSATGPSWVASVVNAVGESPYWNSTAIVVLWDDWGGWYDNAPPPQLDYRGLAERVPCIIISPYAKRGYVSHTQYEFGSVLKFVEQVFALPPLGPASLGYTDSRATSIADSFTFAGPPHAFVPIAVRFPRAYFLTQRAPNEPPDSQ